MFSSIQMLLAELAGVSKFVLWVSFAHLYSHYNTKTYLHPKKIPTSIMPLFPLEHDLLSLYIKNQSKKFLHQAITKACTTRVPQAPPKCRKQYKIPYQYEKVREDTITEKSRKQHSRLLGSVGLSLSSPHKQTLLDKICALGYAKCFPGTLRLQACIWPAATSSSFLVAMLYALAGGRIPFLQELTPIPSRQITGVSLLLFNA